MVGEETTGDGDEPSPVEPDNTLPVDLEILVAEAEEALKNTGEQSTGESNLLVEFYYGKAKQDGRTVKTGKIYWIYTRYEGGKRRRISPTKVFGKRKGITSIENCPHKGRVLQFHQRSLTFKSTGKNTGGSNSTGRLQGPEGSGFGQLADQ